MPDVSAGLSLMMSEDFRVAAGPLFDESLVDIVEWSFDMGWNRPIPLWLQVILDEYSANDRLLGHGVSYSALDASQTDRQTIWLQQLRREVANFHYTHISEHFGFMGGGNFHIAAPLPVPRSAAALAVGRERLADLAAVAGVPVGLENLAFAFHLEDVRQQGPFLDELLEPVDGFLLLDLHNLYCQSCNFGVPLMNLVDLYPLDRVRELHISGGSWSEHPCGSGNQVRRDTHDGPVPQEIFEVLPEVLKKCPHVIAVIMERMERTIDIDDSRDVDLFREDFRRLKMIVTTDHGQLK